MTHRYGLWTVLFPGPHLFEQLEKIMTDIDGLNAAIAQLGVDLGEAVARIEAKLAGTDIDLSDEISTLRGFSEQLDALGADPVEPPPEP